MFLPFVIDNQQHRLADALNDLLKRSAGTPLDVLEAKIRGGGEVEKAGRD